MMIDGEFSEKLCRQMIRRMLDEEFLLGEDLEAVKDDTSLVDAGIVDSTGVLELVQYIEEKIGFDVPDADLLPENFDSIDKLVAYVEKRHAEHRDKGGAQLNRDVVDWKGRGSDSE